MDPTGCRKPQFGSGDRVPGSRVAPAGLGSRGAARFDSYACCVRVVGIDPGLAARGYSVVEAQGAKAETLGFGCWQTAAGVRIELRLPTLFVGLTELLIRCRPDVVALEESFVGLDARRHATAPAL